MTDSTDYSPWVAGSFLLFALCSVFSVVGSECRTNLYIDGCSQRCSPHQVQEMSVDKGCVCKEHKDE